MSSRRRKYRKANKRRKKRQTKENDKGELRKAQNHKTPPKTTFPNTLNTSSPPYIDIILFLFSTTRLAKSSINFVPILSPPLAMNSSNTNREKNEMLCMRFKIRVLHKVYKQVFKQLCTPLYQDLQNKSESSQGDNNRITRKYP
jgi:hypothetical protein